MKRLALVLVLLSAFAGGCCFLPIPVYYTHGSGVSGKVLEAGTDRPIPGAAVLVRNTSENRPDRSATTASDGSFRVPADWDVHFGVWAATPSGGTCIPQASFYEPRFHSVEIDAEGYEPGVWDSFCFSSARRPPDDGIYRLRPLGTLDPTSHTTTNAPRELRVGPGGDFAKPSEAAAAVRDGDTVVIEAGEWTGDVCVWRANDIRIHGAGPDKTILDADGRAAAGKGLWVVQGTNVTIHGVSFRGAACPDRNGAGIRHEADGALTVSDCRFENNENGFLSGVATNAVLTFERCVFRDNGAGDGLSHNVYVGRAKRLVFRDCASDHAREGHALKSRALETVVENCVFDDGDDGRSSYLVDCPNGGRVRIAGCRFVQSPVAPNGTMVSVGEEGGLYPDSALDLRDNANRFENRRASGTEVRSFVPEAKDAWRRDR